MTLYEILGVRPEATGDEIRKAYRRLAQQHHPDKGGDASLFCEIQKAYEVLSSPSLRAEYDATGRTPESATDRLRAQVLSELQQVVQAAMQSSAQPGFNLLDACLSVVRSARGNASAGLRATTLTRDRYTKAKERLILRDNGDRALLDIVENNLAVAAKEMVAINEQLSRLDMIDSILLGYSYVIEPETQRYTTSTSRWVSYTDF